MNESTQNESQHVENAIVKTRVTAYSAHNKNHGSVALQQLENVYVGRLKINEDDGSIQTEKLAGNYAARDWYPLNFPKNDELRSPAFCHIIKKIMIFSDRKIEFELNSQTGQSAFRFRFAFENMRDEIWFFPGDKIEISIPDDYGRPITESFTPVTCHVENYIDIHLKIYQNSKVSKLLDILEPGDLVAVRGPIPHKLPILSSKFSPSGCAQQLILLCAGGGVSLGMQTVDYYLSFCPRNEDGRVLSKIGILCFSRNEQETMLNDELEKLKRVSSGAVEIFYCFTKSDTWNGPKGRVCKSLLEKTVLTHINFDDPY